MELKGHAAFSQEKESTAAIKEITHFHIKEVGSITADFRSRSCLPVLCRHNEPLKKTNQKNPKSVSM